MSASTGNWQVATLSRPMSSMMPTANAYDPRSPSALGRPSRCSFCRSGSCFAKAPIPVDPSRSPPPEAVGPGIQIRCSARIPKGGGPACDCWFAPLTEGPGLRPSERSAQAPACDRTLQLATDAA